MAGGMYSFLDTSLYGAHQEQTTPPSGTSPSGAVHNQTAPPLRPASTDEGLPAEPRKPACLDQGGLNQVMESLQARILSAEKRTAVMEQRLLGALEGMQKPLPQASTTPSYALLLCIGIAVFVFFFMGKRSQSSASPPIPMVMPTGTMPASPLVFPLNASSASFLK